MATERLSMRKAREILRQKWELDRTHREIAASVGQSDHGAAQSPSAETPKTTDARFSRPLRFAHRSDLTDGMRDEPDLPLGRRA